MDLINLHDYEARAKQVLPHSHWEHIEAGAMDGLTTARNRSAFEALTLRPRFMRDVTERKISTTVLGTDISFPVMISPADGHATAHPEGERATARGAGMSNTLMMCSTNSNNSMEEIAEVATGPLWFQLAHRGYRFTENLVKRAEAAGFKAIVGGVQGRDGGRLRDGQLCQLGQQDRHLGSGDRRMMDASAVVGLQSQADGRQAGPGARHAHQTGQNREPSSWCSG